ncbi:MAG: alpha-glucosidase [Clostridiales bacterium]|jgi:oligo-1,6-glucosidase|nr:alpha-glucosidase [Clostridiales bacterium]
MKTKWFKDAFIYQIYPRSFCDGNGDGIGDIRGIISKLDYLKDLGINAVWLSPCYKSPNDDNGYDISDYRDIMEEFGTLDDWKEMVKGMHDRGIKLIMDLVVNHTSDEHAWFVESKKSTDNPYRDYYFWKKGRGKDGKKPPNNWISRFGGSAWTYDENTDEFYLHLFSKKQPDLNWDNPKVREEVKGIVKYWLDLGADGFRCDVITYISKVEGLPDGKLGGDNMFTHGPNIHKYLQELYTDVLSKYDCMTVGEAAGVTTDQAKLYTGNGRGELDTVFQFEHVEVNTFAQIVPRKVKLNRIKEVLSKWQTELFGNGWNSLYLENHDQPRCVSRYINDNVDGDDFLRKQSAKMLMTMMYFQQGTPYVYQGQEIGMTNIEFHSEEEHVDVLSKTVFRLVKKYAPFLKGYAMRALAIRSRDNARTPMQWNAEKNAGFSDGLPWYRVNPNYTTINTEEALKDPDSVLNFLKKIIEIRKGNETIRDGRYIDIQKDSKDLFAYRREAEVETLEIICNYKNKEVNYRADAKLIGKGAKIELILSNYQNIAYDQAEYRDFILKPYECRVYSIKK